MAWLYVFSRTWRLGYQPWEAYASLGLAVWIIYAADRLLDASLATLPADQLGAKDEELFGRIVTAAFGQRRKTLRNTLREFIDEAGLAELGIDAGLRGERLSVAQYIAIANRCS